MLRATSLPAEARKAGRASTARLPALPWRRGVPPRLRPKRCSQVGPEAQGLHWLPWRGGGRAGEWCGRTL